MRPYSKSREKQHSVSGRGPAGRFDGITLDLTYNRCLLETMSKRLYTRAIDKLLADGLIEFLSSVREHAYRTLVPKLDSIAKENQLFASVIIPLFGVLNGEIIIKKPDYYVRYTPFGTNIFGRLTYCFPDLKQHRRIEQREYYIDKYFSNEEVFIEPSDTVFEVGAARGVTTQIAAERAKSVIALEASPRALLCLQKNINRDDVEIHQKAAWNKKKKMEIKYGQQSGDDSLIMPNSEYIGISEQVQADTIESFVSNMGINGVDFLKVEAEGAEPEVIQGISGLNIEKVVVNCSPERDGESPVDTVSEMLCRMNYKIVDFDGRLYAKKKDVSKK